MRFIHSFWSKPFKDKANKFNWNLRHHGGFPSEFLFYAAWCYSCLSIKKYYGNLHLVTDNAGLGFFKNTLQLPYTSFSSALNEIESYHKGLWALGKLYTYSIQEEPFCHLDGDVFLFGKVLDPILDAPLFCQSFDLNKNQYVEIHPYVWQHFENVPDAFAADLSQDIPLINAGVIGGSNLELFKTYTDKAFKLIDHNTDKLDSINVGLLNLYYEQFLFSNLIQKHNLNLASLYPMADSEVNYNFAAFHEIPKKSMYVHLISHLKKNTEFMEQVVARLYGEFPDYYYRLVNLFKPEAA